MIEVKSLKKSFDDNLVLDEITMTIEPGKIYGLVGSNGCGKTTILKHIMSIYQPDGGQVLFDGVCISNDDYLNELYYVQDDLYFPFNYTLDDLFEYESMMYKKMSRKKYEQLKTYFKTDGQKKLRSLSKGQKKQAAFILSISAMTSTVLLDEIVDGLDAVIRKKFWQVIMSEVMDRSLTLVISSHALKELDNICDRVGILHDGKIVREDDIDLIKEDTKRVQFAITEDFTGLVSDDFEVVKDTLVGKVHFAVVRGNVDTFEHLLNENYHVLLFEILMMNLEEIFISELGGLGYGNEEYISD